MRLLPCGDAAVLVEVATLEEVLALTAALQAERAAGRLGAVVDVVPAARTVLLRTATGSQVADVASQVRGLAVAPGSRPTGEQVRIDVRYDGPDLDEVAALAGVPPDEVVRLHTDTEWTVAFTGFSPGFGYLVGGDRRLRVPRRREPRTRVPAGSVGLGGEFSGIYPRESPGGWQLIGRTDAVLWDPRRDQPALLTPGVRVRFVAVDATGERR